MGGKVKFFLDIDVEKSEGRKNASPEDKYKDMVFSGVASDLSRDQDGEVVDPNGFDLSYFNKNGLFNLDHLTSRAPFEKSKYWIGEPIESKVENSKLVVKGKLWEKSPEARAFYDKCLEMKESGSLRKPGMSIEGKILSKDKNDPTKVTGVLITNIALTMNPVNGNSYLDILKGIVKPEDEISTEIEDTDSLLEIRQGDKIVTIKKSFEVEERGIETPTEKVIKLFMNGDITEEVLSDCLSKV